jgi:Glycosyl hydrolase family 57
VKKVHVILAFHAHEPLWDLPRRLQRTALDRRIASGVLGESWVRRRVKEGRNVYRDLIAFATRLAAPLALDLSNELLHQLRRHTPGTFRQLAASYRSGLLAPVYLAAHHTHPALLEPDEFIDELRLNREAIHGVLGAPEPRRRGVFFTECSVDSRLVPALESAGYHYTFCPALAGRYAWAADRGTPDLAHAPFRVGQSLVALPRHFPVSQEVWRPLTRRFPERVKYQGFLVGQTPVFADEYRSLTPAPPDPDPEHGVAEYAAVLRQAIASAPDGGLIVYLQDLELMDFGEAALELLDAAWRLVIAERTATIELTTPERYLEEHVPDARALPRVRFRAASWAPELRPALRSDGHYPPRGAGPFRGHDADREIFRRRPFVFWEPGRFHASVFGWLLDAFAVDRVPAVSATTLLDEDYRLERFPPRIRLPLLYRLMKRACNWGWYPEEGLAKRPYLDGYLIADALRLELGLPGRAPEPRGPLPFSALEGLRRLPELLVDPRIDYLAFGLERWREERGADPTPALIELDEARAARHTAVLEIARARDACQGSRIRWRELVTALRDHSGAVFLAFDHIQRAWGKSDPEFLITAMYRYLYDLFPPRGPQLLNELLGAPPDDEEALATVEGAEAP